MHALKHPIRFLSIFTLVLSAAFFGNAGTAAAANPLLCFDGPSEGTIYGGSCVINPGGTSATLNTADGDPDGSYAGVYYAESNLSGDLVTTVTGLSFTYTCTSTAATCVTGGSPRMSIPIDTNNNGGWDGFAFIDAANCGETFPSGTVDQICPVFFGSTLYTTWAAFATQNPTYRIATNAIPFVIADQPFRGVISNVQLGQGEDANVATRKNECKDGGWANLTRSDDTEFKNQGDCIQYVNTGK